jgi:branched-chain amino acid transport system substrate-binding protein
MTATVLQADGANVLLVAATPKFVAQAIRNVHDLDWKPLFFMSFVSASVGAVINPAGPENATGMITGRLLEGSERSYLEERSGAYVFAYAVSKGNVAGVEAVYYIRRQPFYFRRIALNLTENRCTS